MPCLGRGVREVGAECEQRAMAALEQRTGEFARGSLQRFGVALGNVDAGRGGQRARGEHEAQEARRRHGGTGGHARLAAPGRRARRERSQRRLERRRIAAARDRGAERRQRLRGEHVEVARRPERVRKPAQFDAHRLDARGGEARGARATGRRAGGARRCASGESTPGRRRPALPMRWPRSARDSADDGGDRDARRHLRRQVRVHGARPGPASAGCRSAKPRSALLSGSSASGTSAASACASSNSRAGSPASSSISISWIGARRSGPSPSVRTSPVSMHSSACVLSGKASGIVVRRISVVKRGATPCRCALPSSRRNGVTAKRSGSSARPATGHSNSVRVDRPAPCARVPRTLDRLHPALAVAPQPQRDAGAREAFVRGVEVRRHERRRARPRAPQRRQQRMARQSRQRLRRDRGA